MSPDRRRLFHRRRIFPSWGHLVHRESCTYWSARSQPFETKARTINTWVLCVEFADYFSNCKTDGWGDLNLSCPDGGGVAACVVVLLHRWEVCLCWIKLCLPACPNQQSRNGFPWMLKPGWISWEGMLAPHMRRTQQLFPCEAWIGQMTMILFLELSPDSEQCNVVPSITTRTGER